MWAISASLGPMWRSMKASWCSSWRRLSRVMAGPDRAGRVRAARGRPSVLLPESFGPGPMPLRRRLGRSLQSFLGRRYGGLSDYGRCAFGSGPDPLLPPGSTAGGIIPAGAGNDRDRGPGRGRPRTGAETGLDGLVQAGMQGIGAVDGGLGQDMALHGLADIGGGEARRQVQLLHVQGVEVEEIAVQAQVVARRVGAVVAGPVAGHVRIAGEPADVVIAALAGAGRAGRVGLAADGDAVAAGPLGDLAHRGRDVGHHPVDELGPRLLDRNLH